MTAEETIRSKVEIYQGVDQQWHWRAKAGNGEIVASGEGYTREEDAKRGFEDALVSMQAAFHNLHNGS